MKPASKKKKAPPRKKNSGKAQVRKSPSPKKASKPKTAAGGKAPSTAPKGPSLLEVTACTDLGYGHLVEGQTVGLGKPMTFFFYSEWPWVPSTRFMGRMVEPGPKGPWRAEPEKAFADPREREKQVEAFLRKIPKTEVHLHLEACVRRETLLTLARRDKKSPIQTLSDVDRLFNFTNLSEFIQVFLAVQDAIQKVEDFNLVFDDLKDYLKKNHIIYCEVFLAVTKFIQKGFAYEAILDLLARRIRELEARDGVRVRLIVDVSRSFGPGNAAANLDRVLANPSDLVIGIGLGGDEKAGPASGYKATFQKAIKAGLHVVAHAGEDVGPESIKSALKDLGAERIGHGLAAIEDEGLMKAMAQKKTPVEVCLTSNVFTGRYTRTFDYHPVQVFHRRGMNITVNSDDPTFFRTDLTRELLLHHTKLHFSLAELVQFIENGALATFHPAKKTLWALMRGDIEKAKAEFPLLIL